MAKGQQRSKVPLTVFLVDDSAEIRALLRARLEQEPGILVVGQAGSAAAAATAIGTLRPSVVIVDLQLEDSSGIAVLQRVQTLDPPPRTVVLTSHVSRTLRTLCLGAGASAFFDKNSEFEQLLALLRSWADHGLPDLPPRGSQLGGLLASDRRSDIGSPLARILESIPDMVLLLRGDGTIVYSSAAAIPVLGYRSMELVGRNFVDLVHPADAERAMEALTNCAEAGDRIVHAQLRVRCAADEWQPVDAIAVNRVSDSTLGSVVLTLRDRSASQRAEDALRDALQDVELAVAASGTGLWSWDLRTNEARLNSQWKAQLGYGDSEVPNRLEEWESRIHPEDRVRVNEAVQAALRGATPAYECEYRLRHRDGSWRWIISRGRVERDRDGQPSRMRGSHVDITERRRVEDILKSDEAEHRLLIEEAPGAIVILDSRGDIVGANQRASEVTGYPRGELLRRNIADTFPAEERDMVPAMLRYLQGHQRLTLERTLLRSDGGRVSVESNASVLPDGRILSLIQDVSERKEREERLRQSQKLEILGQLTGGIAHDFNNLLTVILANAGYLVAESQLTPDAEAAVRDLQGAAERGAIMIRRLMGFARNSELQLAPLIPHDVFSEIYRLMRRVIPSNIELQFHCPDDLPPMLADSVALEQCVLNLTTNARDAMPDGGVLQLTVDRIRHDVAQREPGVELPAGDYLRVVVADSGAGMDAATLRRIFEPFFTTKGAGHGTGLGMLMVERLVKQHGGAVTVDSATGIGTTICLYFPVIHGESGVESGDSDPHPLGGSERILLVDDDVAIVRVAQRALERAGYRVTVASDGEAALALFEANGGAFDLVVSDLVMPRLGGADLHSVLRAKRADVRFVLTTAYLDAERATPIEGAASLHLLQKPWSADDLLRHVRRVLDSHV